MRFIVTTSNAYCHIVPIFIHLFQKFWGPPQQVEIVGYEHPGCELPPNFSFVSLGKQGGKKDFSNDLRKYFEKQDQFVIWSMEDNFFKAPVRFDRLEMLYKLTERKDIGRIELTGENQQHHLLPYDVIDGVTIKQTPPKSEYRLSTQIAIWNKDYLLRYLTPNLSPWEFECQKKVEDEFHNIGLSRADAPVSHNEGVTRHNLFAYNFRGIPEEVLQEMRDKKIIPLDNVEWKLPDEKITAYLNICKQASEDDKVFETFKRNPAFNYVLEHTSAKLGEEYKRLIEQNGHEFLLEVSALWSNDNIGSPVKKNIGGIVCSPTTMQYIAVLSNIIKNYDGGFIPDDASIIEIGGGYGGQCKTILNIVSASKYHIVDLAEVGLLQRKYLDHFGLRKVVLHDPEHHPKDDKWDIVISNYALSEVREPQQTEYVKNICLNSRHGYLTCNSPIHAVDLIKDKFADTFSISKDIPEEVESNFILTW